MSMLRSFRASPVLRRLLAIAPCTSTTAYRLLRSSLVLRPVPSRHKHTRSVSMNQASISQIASEHLVNLSTKHNAEPPKVVVVKKLVKAKASEARRNGNLDAALEAYLDARRTFQSKKFHQVKMYLYKQLATLRPLVRDGNDLPLQEYESFKKRLPWPNTSSRLRQAFYEDIKSGILSDDKERQHAILRLYDATKPDPAPFLIYCRQLSEEDLEPTRSLVTEIGEACKDAQVALEHTGDYENAT